MATVQGTFTDEGSSAELVADRPSIVRYEFSAPTDARVAFMRGRRGRGAFTRVGNEISDAASGTFYVEKDEVVCAVCTYADSEGSPSAPYEFSVQALEGESVIPIPSVAAVAAGVRITNVESGLINRTRIELDDVGITVTDALAYADKQLATFPTGRILVYGVLSSLQFSVTSDRTATINASAAMDYALGSVAASNTTLSSTMVDLLAKQDHTLDGADDAFTAAANAALAAAAQFDGTSTPLSAYLNVSFPTGTEIDADGTLVARGWIEITWTNLGKY
jgi:hypothetical protein